MSEPSLALQKAIRGRLAGTSAVLALVPADAILDRHARPERFPCVVIGEGQTLYSRLHESYFDRVILDLHVWLEEAGTTGAKEIAGAIRTALADGPLITPGFHVSDLTVASARFLRDPDGQHSHGVITVEAIMQELVA